MPQTPPTLISGGNIYPNRFVMMDSSEDQQGIQATANAVTVGISGDSTKYPPLTGLVSNTYHAEDGDPITLRGAEESQTLLELGGTVAAGDYLKSDSNGKGVAIATSGTTPQNVGARALKAGVSGDLLEVEVMNASVSWAS